MLNVTYNDVLSAYSNYPAPIRPFLVRAETHPILRTQLTKSFMRVVIAILSRAPIADPARPLTFRAELLADHLGLSTKTVTRAINLLRYKGWLKRHPDCDGRNNWGEFSVSKFVLGDELRAMVGLPIGPHNGIQEDGNTSAAEASFNSPDEHNDYEEGNRHSQLVSQSEQHGDAMVRAVDNIPVETQMSPGVYTVNKVFLKEASFQQGASDSKASTPTPKKKSPKIPVDLTCLQTELGIDPKGICTLMQIAKSAKQRLQHVWIAKRDQLLASGATEGRAVNYLKYLLGTGEDFAYRAQLRTLPARADASTSQRSVASVAQDPRIYWNKKFCGANSLRVRIHGDGSAEITDLTRQDAYVRPADMIQIYEAIAAGQLWILEE
jgi:hypothetical protein